VTVDPFRKQSARAGLGAKANATSVSREQPQPPAAILARNAKRLRILETPPRAARRVADTRVAILPAETGNRYPPVHGYRYPYV